MHQHYDTPEALRSFLKLCLDPGYGVQRSPETLAEVLPEPLVRKAVEFAPHLGTLRHAAQALDEQAKKALRAYAAALASWIHDEEPKSAPAPERFVIGRDGVFATLYDWQENRVVVENASEEHCRRVRDELLAADGRPCKKCDAPFTAHIGWARGHLYAEPDEPQPAPAPRRSMPLLEAAAVAHDAAVAHAAKCGTCWPGMRLGEMCPDGQRAAVASLDQAGPDPDCAHIAWEVTSEHRNELGTWTKFRKCSDCGDRLESLIDAEPHRPEKAARPLADR
ncbi:hypothetical protein [Streptomyces sp. NPDC006334]|uniref:hypothetical protein n=1 Tax=Streptomyces sp. NPDC006334 TaxID=3156754 RepID=UPI0033BAB738